eukprot:maker-scaffold74_size411160-snap-gene-3.17 protein:Tk04225 transcript:maker-scaffold74_size411160-snap-gene-3.17-mRNA-1 annotation:"type iv pilus-associated protein"
MNILQQSTVILGVLLALDRAWSDKTAPTVVNAAGLQCFVDGECLDSMLIDVEPTNTSSMCLHHCQNTRGCEWFTWYKDTSLCASLSVCLRLNGTYCGDNCVSGEVECPEFYCGVKGKCLGALEGMRLVADVAECRA